MTDPIDLSAIVLSDRHPPREFLADVAQAEQVGVRTVWAYDHLVWPQLIGRPWYGSIPLLAAAAMTSTRVRLGLQVATPNFRHPVPFAKELMTLDQLTGGRLEVGLGAGVDNADAFVLGDPPLTPKQRTDRFSEWLGLLDRLLRDPLTTERGEWYSAIEAHMLPGCVQSPRLPFTVAATGPRALALAATFGQAWVTYGPHGPQVEAGDWFDALAAQAARLDESLDAAGRPRTELRRIAQFALDVRWPFESETRYRDTLGRLGELGFAEVTVHWGRPDGRGLPAAALDLVAAAHEP
jgi:alkanesulfonate monooxygenase SsuD/methylene tetrahydromethanopterin reductase-like flavin-dependent oxidoreductase (luciferase family)